MHHRNFYENSLKDSLGLYTLSFLPAYIPAGPAYSILSYPITVYLGLSYYIPPSPPIIFYPSLSYSSLAYPILS